MTTHEGLYAEAIRALADLFADTSVSQLETASDLRAIADEIEMMIGALATAQEPQPE